MRKVRIGDGSCRYVQSLWKGRRTNICLGSRFDGCNLSPYSHIIISSINNGAGVANDSSQSRLVAISERIGHSVDACCLVLKLLAHKWQRAFVGKILIAFLQESFCRTIRNNKQ